MKSLQVKIYFFFLEKYLLFEGCQEKVHPASGLWLSTGSSEAISKSVWNPHGETNALPVMLLLKSNPFPDVPTWVHLAGVPALVQANSQRRASAAGPAAGRVACSLSGLPAPLGRQGPWKGQPSGDLPWLLRQRAQSPGEASGRRKSGHGISLHFT